METSSSALEVEEVAEFALSQPNISFWKMNLLAVSEADSRLFVAFGDVIRAFDLQPDYTIGNFVDLPVPASNIAQGNSEINYIRMGTWNGGRVIAAVTMDGQIAIFRLETLSEPPVMLNNYLEEAEDNSTWSLSICGTQLAVGSNSYTIGVWDGTTFQQRLTKHAHNVPCLDFSPGGRFLASTSIDTTVDIWQDRQCLLSFRPSREWGWGVRWIHKGDFLGHKHSSSEEESLQDLALAHTSQSELRLVTFTSYNKVKTGFTIQYQMNPLDHRRLSLLETIPHLSLLIVGEWGGTKIYGFRLFVSGEEYTAETVFAYDVSQLLLGLSVSSWPERNDAVSARLYALLASDEVKVYEFTSPLAFSLPSLFL